MLQGRICIYKPTPPSSPQISLTFLPYILQSTYAYSGRAFIWGQFITQQQIYIQILGQAPSIEQLEQNC